MKQQDIAIVIIIVFVAGIASYFVSSKFITPNKDKRVVYSVGAITSEFNVPPENVFNENAKNPTVRIRIAPNENEKPFTDAQQ